MKCFVLEIGVILFNKRVGWNKDVAGIGGGGHAKKE